MDMQIERNLKSKEQTNFTDPPPRGRQRGL
jgi:hypothetical protein